MQLKKLLQGSTFALVAAACAIAVPSVAHAEEPEAGTLEAAKIESVSISGSYLTAQTSSKEVLVGFAKVKSGKASVASWGSYEVPGEDAEDAGYVAVDLSKLNSGKDNYIAIKGSGAKSPAIIKVNATTQKKLKATFDAATGQIQVGEGSAAAIKDNSYVYRTQYSSYRSLWEWKDETDLAQGGTPVSLEMFQEEGAKLFVRKGGDRITTYAGTEDGGDLTDADDLLKQGSTTVKFDGTTDVKLYEAKTAPLPSSEVKVTIPAKAKGPKVAVNYLKGTVKIPAKTEWRLVTAEKFVYADDKGTLFADTGDKTVKEILAKANPASTSANSSTAQLRAASHTQAAQQTEAARLTAEAAAGDGSSAESATLEVRKKQSGKKLASKWTTIELNEPVSLADKVEKNEDDELKGNVLDFGFAPKSEDDGTLGTDKNTEAPVAGKYNAGVEVKYGDAGVKNAVLLEGTGNSSVLSISYAAADKKATKYNLKINNSGKVPYDFVVKAKDSKADSISDSDKVYTAKVGKEITLKNVTDGQVIFVRLAGDKKNKTWVGAFEQLGIVDLPKSVTGTKVVATPTAGA